jgi:hypothetical protein
MRPSPVVKPNPSFTLLSILPWLEFIPCPGPGALSISFLEIVPGLDGVARLQGNADSAQVVFQASLKPVKPERFTFE